MKRSKWKGPFINYDLIKNINTKVKTVKIYERNSLILPSFVGKKFQIYNGKKFNLKLITENMVGHKFGEFSLKRQPFKYKKKNK